MDKFRSIEYFLRVAEAKSVAAAANKLEVTPSAVSKVIAALEGSIGFSLFNRSTRHLSLTHGGEIYLERCRHILQQVAESESAGRRLRTSPAGTVKVGLHPAFRNPFFGELGRLLSAYPDIRLETKIT